MAKLSQRVAGKALVVYNDDEEDDLQEHVNYVGNRHYGYIGNQPQYIIITMRIGNVNIFSTTIKATSSFIQLQQRLPSSKGKIF